MSKLNTYVPVQDAAGKTHLLGPDSEIPAWAEEAIKNPEVWAEAPASHQAAESASEDGEAEGQSDAGEGEALAKPAPNANAEKWLAYAESIKVDVPEKDRADRDIIKALVKAADTGE